MALMIDNKLLFFHVPKTGGKWLTRVLKDSEKISLKEIGHKHATYDFICGMKYKPRDTVLNRALFHLKRSRFNNNFRLNKDYKIVSVVRNPLKWYESLYQYLAETSFRKWGEKGDFDIWHPWSELNHYRNETFNDWMKDINEFSKGYCTNLFNSYTRGSNSIILKNENLRNEFLELCIQERIKIDQEKLMNFDDINVSKKLNIKWDREVYQNVLDFDSATFSKYDYDVEGIVDFN